MAESLDGLFIGSRRVGVEENRVRVLAARIGETGDIQLRTKGPNSRPRSFTGILEAEGIMISMDGRGRVYDNIFVERLWRSVKYEEVYLREYATVKDAVLGLGDYFRFYNDERPHQALRYKTQHQLYTAQTYSPGTTGQRITQYKVYFFTLKKSIFCLDRGVHLILVVR